MINEAERAQQLKEINRKLIKVQVLGAMGPILLGLALYGIFGVNNGDAFHPLLNDSQVVYGMLTIGIAILVLEFIVYIRLLMRRAKLTKVKV